MTVALSALDIEFGGVPKSPPGRERDRAIEMLRAAGKHDKIADPQTRLDLYQNRQPYRD